MKKFFAFMLACAMCFCCAACDMSLLSPADSSTQNSADSNKNKGKYTIEFVENGEKVATYTLEKGKLLSNMENIPAPTQPTDDDFVSEWSYDATAKCQGDMRIEVITYTKGLKFYKYYSSIAMKDGYELAAGYEGKAEHILIPETYKGLPVLKVADKAFDGSSEGNTTIKKVTLPNTLVEIGNLAFNHCKALTDVEIPSSVCSLGTSAFYGAPIKGTLKLSGAIGVIPTRSFQGTHFDTVIFGEGITTIEAHSFTTGYTLTVVVLPSTIEKIDAVAFWQQPVEKFFYAGTEDDWSFVEISSSAFPNEAEKDNLESYLEKGIDGVRRGTPKRDEHGNRITKVVYPTLYFYSEERPAESGNYWHFVDGEPAMW